MLYSISQEMKHAETSLLADPHHDRWPCLPSCAIVTGFLGGAAAGSPECKFRCNSCWQGSALGATVEPPGPSHGTFFLYFLVGVNLVSTLSLENRHTRATGHDVF